MADRGLECPVFFPTLADVNNLSFAEYVASIEPQWQHVGICRIVAPPGWTPRRSGYRDLSHLTLPRPIRQHVTGRQGLYRTLLVEQRNLSLPAFRAMAEAPENAAPGGADADALERKFWKNVPMNPPLYGADVLGSLFDDRARGWNLRRLDSILSRALDASGAAIPGVTQPYLYAGSYRSFFGIHVEDCDLHSVNYIHTGAPKTWYVVPPAGRPRFEQLARDLLPELARECPEFLRHKEILLSPSLLAAHNIPLVKAVHRAREFVVVGPGAYHAGFNHGFNLAESVNFATPAWAPVGARASFCTCRPDSVKIDMRLFTEFMDPELAAEVVDSYGSDSEGEEGHACCASDSEGEEEEEEEEEAAAGGSESEEESSSESESESESEDEEVLPEKRVRRPTVKAMENGMAPSPPAAAAAAPRQRPKAARPQAMRGSATRGAVRPGPAAPAGVRKRAGDGGAAAARRQVRQPVRTFKRQRAEAAALPAAAGAVAHIHASSSDDEAGGRAGPKRGAAKAWGRLFASLLPSLKRVKT